MRIRSRAYWRPRSRSSANKEGMLDMRPSVAWLFLLLLSSCGIMPPASYVAPAAAGKSPTEVSKLVAASEAKLFPCSIHEVRDVAGAAAVDLGGNKSDVTLAPGRYRVTLFCSSGHHNFKPQAEVSARAGRSYRITGYLVDDSITIFTMKMGARVSDLR